MQAIETTIPRDELHAAARRTAETLGGSSARYRNLITTFLDLADLDSACAVADHCSVLYCGDVRLLSSVFQAYAFAFRLEDAMAVAREGLKLMKHVPGVREDAFDTRPFEQLMLLRDEHGYTNAALKQIFEAAVAVLLEAGAGPLRFSRMPLPDGSFTHFFHIHRSIEECARLDWLIAERLVERFDRNGSEFMILSCLPMRTYHELNLGRKGGAHAAYGH